MFERKWIIFHNSVPCGYIGNVEVYKTASGYCLVAQDDNSKFVYIR